MFRSLFIAFAMIFSLAHGAIAETALETHGVTPAFENWLPKKAYVAYHYNDDNDLDGFRVIFEANDGKLFDAWKIKNGSGEHPFPFVLEATLVLPDDADAWRLEKDDNQFGFGRLDGNNNGVPDAYVDSAFGDWTSSNFGIGILNPRDLEGGQLYDFWVKLKPSSLAFWRNPRNISAQLRFRLNIDVSEAARLGYSKEAIESAFQVGSEWKGGYDGAKVIELLGHSPSAQEVGEVFSFALEKYLPKPNLAMASDFMVGMHADGAYCREDGKDMFDVGSVNSCFPRKEAQADNSGSDITWTDRDMQDSTWSAVVYHDAHPETESSVDQVDLTIDFDILDVDGNELQAGKDPLGPMQVDLRTQATAKNADAGKWKTRDDADTISVNWYVRYQYQDGSWTDWDQIGDHGNLSIGKLDKGDTIQETRRYTIQSGDFIRVEFRSKIDTDNEVDESNEGNNSSRIESFEYDPQAAAQHQPNLVMAGLSLTNGRTQLTQGDTFGLQAWVQNIGGRRAAAGRMAYYLQPPNEGMRYVMDDGVDELGPGEENYELTRHEPFTAYTGGWWYAYGFADYQGNATESNEEDNGFGFWFYVVPAVPQIVIDDLWVDYDGKRVSDGGSGKKDKRYHPNVTFHNAGNGRMSCAAEVRYYINADRYRDRDTVDPLAPGQGSYERVNNNDIKLGDTGWRTYRVTLDSYCGEFPHVERTMGFSVKK